MSVTVSEVTPGFLNSSLQFTPSEHNRCRAHRHLPLPKCARALRRVRRRRRARRKRTRNAHPVPSGSACASATTARVERRCGQVASRSLARLSVLIWAKPHNSSIRHVFSTTVRMSGHVRARFMSSLSPFHSVYPTLNASTGLMDAARLAGMIPAMAADTASVAAAATITVKFTLVIP